MSPETFAADRPLSDDEMLTSEIGVLGSMLIDPETVGPVMLKLEESDFLCEENRDIFRAFRARYSRGEPVDAMLVADDLGSKYRPMLAQYIDNTPTAANAELYAEMVKRQSRLYQLRQLGAELNQAADEASCRELLDRANMLLCERSGVRRLTMEQGFREFFKRRDGRKRPDYLHWGFSDLDNLLHVGPGDMVVIGGYASAGKTALALQMSFRIAREKRVGFFSYETDADKLTDRNIACQTQISFSRIMKNTLTDDDYRQVYDMKDAVTSAKLDLLETSHMTVSDIGSYAMSHHYDVIVVDYLQKIPAARSSRHLSEFDRVSQVSNDLQQLGRRTRKIIIALSQLSRAEKRPDGTYLTPTLSSLRQSGQIEQDADVVLLLWKKFHEADSTDGPEKLLRYLQAAKNKDGESGRSLCLSFDGDKQRFRVTVDSQPPRLKPKHEPPDQQSIFKPIPPQGPNPF